MNSTAKTKFVEMSLCGFGSEIDENTNSQHVEKSNISQKPSQEFQEFVNEAFDGSAVYSNDGSVTVVCCDFLKNKKLKNGKKMLKFSKDCLSLRLK